MNLKEIKELIELCKEHGIDYVKSGDVELHFGSSVPDLPAPAAVHPDLGLDFDDYTDPYKDPALYPGGQDPVAFMRKQKEEMEQVEVDRAKNPSTG